MDTLNSAQRPYAFVRAGDGNVWVNWWNGSAWAWTNQGLPPGVGIIGEVGVITVMDSPNSSQRPYVFCQGSDGNLWVNWWNGSAWLWADQGTPPGVSIVDFVGVLTVKNTANSPQRPYAFILGGDGHLWVNWWNGLAWLWADQGTPPGVGISWRIGVLTVKDTPTSAERPYVFVRTSDGHLWVNWWNGSAWSWANQGTPPALSVNDLVGVLTVKDTPNSAERPYVFVRGSDGHLWVNWWNGSAWSWANQGTPPAVSISGFAGVLTVMDTPNSAQRPYAFVLGSDGHLWVNWWNGSAWSWANQGTPPGVSIAQSEGVLTVMDSPNSSQRPYAFVLGNDGHLWVNWWS